MFKRRGIDAAHCVASATAAESTAHAIICNLQFHCALAVTQACAHAWRGTAAPVWPGATFSTPRIPNPALDRPETIHWLISLRIADVAGQCLLRESEAGGAHSGMLNFDRPWRIWASASALAAHTSSDYAIVDMPWITSFPGRVSIERRRSTACQPPTHRQLRQMGERAVA